MLLLSASLYPLMEEAKRLCKVPGGRDWWWGKLDLCLVGRVMLSKLLIQLSVDDWVPSLVVVCPEVTQLWGLRALWYH